MRYAKALMKYAKDSKTEDCFYAQMSTLANSFAKQPELREALDNPTLPMRKKYSLIRTAAVGLASVNREFSRFITLVLKNGRESVLHYVSLAYMDLYRKSRHIAVAKVITAVPVSKEVEDRIQSNASSILHTHVELKSEIDPSIKGGFIFDINDYRLDASVATQLRRVKKQFIDKNRRIV